MRALIVDDSNFIREYLRLHLQQIGWECAEAPSGNEALDLLARSQPSGVRFQVMFCDVNMPGISGLECVRQVRDLALAPGMKMMMVTTEADHSFIQQAFENGAEEFLMKPFSPQGLREKLLLMGFELAT